MSGSEVSAPRLFNLTQITGRKQAEDRETVILTMEFSVRHVRAFLWGLIPTLPLAGIIGLLIGPYAIPVWAVLMGGWFYLFDRTSKTGLRVKTWQTIQDKRRTLAGRIIQCGEVVEDNQFDPFQIMQATVPLQRPEMSFSDVFDLSGASTVYIDPDDNVREVAPGTAPSKPRKPKKRRRSAQAADPSVFQELM